MSAKYESNNDQRVIAENCACF